MFNTGNKCPGKTFTLKAMPKPDHLGVLFQELRVEGSRCFDVLSRLLFITLDSRVGVDTIYALLRKNTDADS